MNTCSNGILSTLKEELIYMYIIPPPPLCTLHKHLTLPNPQIPMISIKISDSSPHPPPPQIPMATSNISTSTPPTPPPLLFHFLDRQIPMATNNISAPPLPLRSSRPSVTSQPHPFPSDPRGHQ